MAAEHIKHRLAHEIAARRARMDAAIAALQRGDSTAYRALVQQQPQRRTIAEIRAALGAAAV